MEILLTNGKFALIDEEDFPKTRGKIWREHSAGYVIWGIHNKGNPKFEFLHRLVMNAPKGVQVDHWNGNRLDCRKNNLRLCNNSQNNKNKGKYKDNSTGYKGVGYDPNRTNPFYASIYSDGKKFWLGSFPTAEKAALAYNTAAIIHHKQFAKLNIIK